MHVHRSALPTALLFSAALLLAACAPVAEPGSKVTVDYVGSLENGTVFDTTIESVAREHGIYSDYRLYAPLIFTLGDGSILAGLDEALVGMSAGDERRVVLAPEDAYGEKKKGLVSAIKVLQTSPRVVKVERELRVPAAVFFSGRLDAQPGDVITSGGEEYTYLRRDGSEVVLRVEASLGDELAIPDVDWPGIIIGEDEIAFTVRQDPPTNGTVETPAGPAKLRVTDDEVIVEVLVEKGGRWRHQQFGEGLVTEHNGTHITVDFNHPLAGETLVFDVMLRALE